MQDFGIHDEVHTTGSNAQYLTDALPTLWVKRPRGSEVRRRVVVRKGCYQEMFDKDGTNASTPPLINLKLILFFGLSKNYHFNCYDVGTAFLHAELQGEVYVEPPVGFYPDGNVIWKLRKTMYRRKTAPGAWQLHFAETMSTCGAKRLRNKPNIHYFLQNAQSIMSYVDDILAVEPQDSTDCFYGDDSQLLPI